MTGIIILAAGESSRLGKPKQNLMFNGKTLLQLAASAAICSVCEPVILVIGANTGVILPEIDGHTIRIVHNPDWQKGMSTSIHAGIVNLQQTPGIESVVIMVCDQPFADDVLINKLVDKSNKSRKGIIASAYKDTLGVPVVFNQKYFPQLLSLNGREGAKKLLRIYSDDIISVPFEKGAIDIDTITDYESLIG